MKNESGSGANAPRRVLVVEDSEALMRFLSDLLGDNGYKILRARNGVEAMVALTAPGPQLPHAVLLDIGLPLESGVSVLEFLRNVMRSGLPVVVLTGSAGPDTEKAVLELGVSAFLRKPASPPEVLAAVARALS